MKKTIFLLAGLGLVLGGFVMSFRVSDAEEGPKVRIRELKKEANESRHEAFRKFQDEQAQARQRLEAQKKELQDRIKAKREEAKSQIESRKAEVKERAKTIRDEKKKQALLRLQESINALNERMTTRYGNMLVHLEDVLGKIESRANKAKANGLNASLTETAISDAKKAIEEARAAVTLQAGKVYTFEIKDEATLKREVGVARQLLHKDLTAAKEAVKSAKEALHQAAASLSKIPRVDEVEVEDESVESSENK